MAKGEDGRTRLMFSNHIKPRVKIGPVILVVASLKNGPACSRVPQAHCPRLRGRGDPGAAMGIRAAGTVVETLKTPICRLYGMTAHRLGPALCVRLKSDYKYATQTQRSNCKEVPHNYD